MDAALCRMRHAGLNYAAIAARLQAEGLGTRSRDAVKARAFLLGIAAETGAPEPLDCRAGNGADPLLAALAAAHKAAPADAAPPPFDARPLRWRGLLPNAGCAGSPASQCAEIGDTGKW